MAANSGWTLDYVEELNLYQVDMLMRFYDQHPPLFLLAEAAAGYKPNIARSAIAPPTEAPQRDVGKLLEFPGVALKHYGRNS